MNDLSVRDRHGNSVPLARGDILGREMLERAPGGGPPWAWRLGPPLRENNGILPWALGLIVCVATLAYAFSR